jgi:CubicO group peptidase (beta-lactamase class C family)
MTRGLILNELFRQIENRTLGDFIEQEIAQKLDGVEYHLGLSPAEEERVIDHLGVTVAWALWGVVRDVTRYFSGTLPKSPQNIEAVVAEYFREGNDMPLLRLSRSVGIDWWKMIDHHNTEFARTRESPSSNGVSNALSLAKIGTLILGNHPELLSASGINEALELEKEEFFDSITKTKIHFTKAGFGRFSDEWNSLAGMYGWHGLGGQLFLFSPEKNMTFVYLTTTFNTSPPWEDTRSQTLLDALL